MFYWYQILLAYIYPYDLCFLSTSSLKADSEANYMNYRIVAMIVVSLMIARMNARLSLSWNNAVR